MTWREIEGGDKEENWPLIPGRQILGDAGAQQCNYIRLVEKPLITEEAHETDPL